MIPTLRSIRNSKRMRFLSLQISVRTGLIRSWSLTLKNGMVRRSVPSAAGPSVISQTNAAAHAVVLLNHFYTKIMVPKGRSSARSVIPDSLRNKAVFPQLSCVVPIVEMLLFQKRTGNTSSSINVWIPNALTIFTTFGKLIKKIWMRTMAGINTNSTISTVNSR